MKYLYLNSIAKLPVPTRENMVKWLLNYFTIIPDDFIQKVFEHINFAHSALSPSPPRYPAISFLHISYNLSEIDEDKYTAQFHCVQKVFKRIARSL